ncbi:hypothetical protein Peur_035139 [Populus x canadensis]
MASQSIIHSTFLVQLLEVDVFQVKIRSVLPHSSLLTVNLDSFMDILRAFELDDSVTGQVLIALGIYSSFRAYLGVGSLVSEIAITTETNFRTRKSMDAESYTLHLSMEENSSDELDRECSYYVWIQKFAVKQENKVEKRMEVEDWVITLAFPNGERLRRGMSSPGIYAFLPTEMVTNFPS